VLIRLCHVADLPTPGDLVRKLHAQGASPSAPSSVPQGGGGVRAMAGGMALAQPALPSQATPQPKTFRDVVALVAEQREMLLHGHLLHSVHLVRFAPPVIELRPQPDAPRDLAPRLGALLLQATGTRWTIALSTGEGEPTLAEQGSEADRGRRTAAADHPLVQAILEAFPGARIEAVRDPGVDAYGLPADIALGEPGLAPIDPEEPAELMDVPIEVEARFLTETVR
jgi:DNA polymerase-3 subunit gamma/tau